MKDSPKVLVVLHGDMPDVEDIRAWSREADVLLAADGGADTILAAGLVPRYVVGDLDGISPKGLAAIPRDSVISRAGQDDTDCRKALAFAIDELGARRIVMAGVEGTRLDHVLSSIYSAAAFARKAHITLSLRTSLAHTVTSGVQVISASSGGFVSVLPLGEAVFTRSAGLKWPLAGIKMSPGARDGISNEAEADEIEIELEAGTAAVFVQRHEGDRIW